MDVVKTCKDVWSSATSDTERFAALLVIVELTKTSDLTLFQCREIFQKIGFSFISRLLQTEQVPDGCSSMLYKSVAVSVLSCFCSDKEIAGSDEMCSLVAEFRKILDANLCSTSEESVVADTLSCLYGISLCQKGREHILSNDIISCLVSLYINGTCGKSRSLQVLRIVSFFKKSETWENHPSAFNDLLSKISKEFSDDCSVENCETILNILLDHPLCTMKGDEGWALEIQVTLAKILRCKITKKLRDLSINLASLMLEKCGAFWFGDGTNSSKMFLVVLIQIVCVEIRLVLEGTTVEDILKDTFVLSACFSILETVIAAMADENLWHPLREHSAALFASVRAACKAVIEFLLMVSIRWKSSSAAIEFPLRQLTYASVRLLCAGLAGHPGVLDDEVHGLLPFFLSLCNECSLAMQCEEHSCEPTAPHVDLMRFFVPPLCHLIVGNAARAILLEHKLTSILFEYMYYQWSVYRENPSSEIEALLSTICGIILNIVVMETRVVTESEEFFSFLKFLCSAATLLPSDNFTDLVLKANFSVLGLLIAKHHYRRIESCEASFYKFLSFSIKFLWHAHHVRDENNTSAFFLVKEYHHVWSDITELWFLGIQALSALLPVMPCIISFLIESGWPQYIITSLSGIDDGSIEENVKSVYQDFLSALVRASRDVLPTFSDCGVISVCKKHKLKELEALLHQ